MPVSGPVRALAFAIMHRPLRFTTFIQLTYLLLRSLLTFYCSLSTTYYTATAAVTAPAANGALGKRGMMETTEAQKEVWHSNVGRRWVRNREEVGVHHGSAEADEECSNEEACT